MSTALSNIYVEQAKALVLKFTAGLDVQVYLFGSRANQTERSCSDIDIAILSSSPLPAGLLAEIREALEDSTIPYTVDVVDLNQTDPIFQKKVLTEGILWTD